jgi:hypothetical protein
LAEKMPTWAEALAPIAERTAHTLGQAMASKYVPVTPLTTDRHRRAQAVVKARKKANKTVAASTTTRQRASKTSGLASWSCPVSGGRVTNHRHVRCDACIEADPRQTAELQGRRGAAIAARKRALEDETLVALPEWATSAGTGPRSSRASHITRCGAPLNTGCPRTPQLGLRSVVTPALVRVCAPGPRLAEFAAHK